MEVLGKKCCGA